MRRHCCRRSSKARDWPTYLQQEALLDLGYALEQKGDAKTAAERYNQAITVEGPYTGIALFAEARMREKLGDKDAARKLYERFVREFPQAPENAVASARAEALKG